MKSSREDDGHLTGMLLVAMPTMQDPRFAHSVIYLCAHSRDGAMGLVVNQVVDNITLPHVIGQLGIEMPAADEKGSPVHFGGPVETSRGFLLHSPDYVLESTLVIDDSFALTATVDVLKAIAAGQGPSRRFFALGYAGWAPGQLESEIQHNGWLTAEPDPAIIFEIDDAKRYTRALAGLGVDLAALSPVAGRA